MIFNTEELEEIIPNNGDDTGELINSPNLKLRQGNLDNLKPEFKYLSSESPSASEQIYTILQ